MNATKRIAVFSTCILLMFVSIVGCHSDRSEWFYPSLTDVKKAEPSAQSWIPDDLLPQSSRNIHIAGELSPSLQMGDADHPVQIYYWNATRGAMLMEAHGRSTTRRTGQAFPAHSDYSNGQWNVTLELPNLAAGTPVAFAVWNGSQKDRDGRKYFSVWQIVE